MSEGKKSFQYFELPIIDYHKYKYVFSILDDKFLVFFLLGDKYPRIDDVKPILNEQVEWFRETADKLVQEYGEPSFIVVGKFFDMVEDDNEFLRMNGIVRPDPSFDRFINLVYMGEGNTDVVRYEWWFNPNNKIKKQTTIFIGSLLCSSVFIRVILLKDKPNNVLYKRIINSIYTDKNLILKIIDLGYTLERYYIPDYERYVYERKMVEVVVSILSTKTEYPEGLFLSYLGFVPVNKNVFIAMRKYSNDVTRGKKYALVGLSNRFIIEFEDKKFPTNRIASSFLSRFLEEVRQHSVRGTIMSSLRDKVFFHTSFRVDYQRKREWGDEYIPTYHFHLGLKIWDHDTFEIYMRKKLRDPPQIWYWVNNYSYFRFEYYKIFARNPKE